MATRSLLFFLDRSQYDVIKSCGGVQGYLPNFCLVYEEAYDFYNLHLAAVETNYHLYEKHFGANVCNTCFKVFCRVWIKSECTCNNLAYSPDWLRRESTSSLDSQIRTSERCESFGCLSVKGLRSTSFEQEIDIGACLEPSWLKPQAEKCLPVSKIENSQVFSTHAIGNNFTISTAEDCGNRNTAKEAFNLSTQNPAPPNRDNTELYQVTSESAPFPLPQDTGKCLSCQQNKNCLSYSPRKRFEKKREKFHAVEFFRERPFRDWQYFFGRRMEMVGWNENGLEKYNRSYYEMWEQLSLDLKSHVQSVEEAKAMLISHLNEQSGKNIDHSIWKKFIAAKRQLASTKRTIYCEVVISSRGYLKYNFPLSNYQRFDR
ncbi:hypothetical protein JTE90_007086 [Oedothorax gibbosus]|uniref:Uncharacterized protein n=1 Tax=Oedothorax gibbosus TaxID=931172 RepID=A0AAV6VTF7_9ARAC|nr:hypothetical protein JTE90_007086 [Oedothorax gibbosus]